MKKKFRMPLKEKLPFKLMIWRSARLSLGLSAARRFILDYSERYGELSLLFGIFRKWDRAGLTWLSTGFLKHWFARPPACLSRFLLLRPIIISLKELSGL